MQVPGTIETEFQRQNNDVEKGWPRLLGMWACGWQQLGIGGFEFSVMKSNG